MLQFVAAIMALPFVGQAVAGLLALFGVSALGLFFPWLNNILLGGALFVAAFFLPNIPIYKGKGWVLGLQSVLGLSALMVVVARFFGVSPHLFGGTVVSTAGNIVSGSVVDASGSVSVPSNVAALVGSSIETTSVLNIGLVVVLTFGLLFAYNRLVKRG